MMITKAIKAILFIITTNTRILYAGIALVLLFSLSFLFGHKILDSQQLIGNDSTYAISLAYWFERWWPKIPLWYPMQGNGVSLFHSYPMGATFLLLFLKYNFSLSIIEGYRLLSFLTFPITAAGIYFFAWARLKNQTVGLLAGVFFLLSQASWVFQTVHGIFAQSFSMIFVAPLFIFFDYYCEQVKKRNASALRGRIAFVTTALLLGLLYWFHVVSGVLISIFMLFYVIVLFLIEFKTPFVTRLLLISKAAIPLIIIGFMLAAFWLLPYFSYNSFANREGLLAKNIGQMQEESLRIPTLLGIGQMGEDPYRYDFFFFATPVLILFVLGGILSFADRSKKVLVITITILFAVYNTMAALLTPWLVAFFTYFFTATYFRALIPVFIFLPLVAAMGAYYLPGGIINILLHAIKKLLPSKITKSAFGKSIGMIIIQLKNVAIAFFTILIGWYLVTHSGLKPPKTRIGEFHAFGPSIDQEYTPLPEKNLKKLLTIPELKIRNVEPGNKSDVAFLVDKLHLINQSRLDISPFAYGGALLKSLPIYTDASFVNLYHYFASLTHAMWGYEQGVFYSKIALYTEPVLVRELSKWFGLEKLIVTHNWDPEDKYEKAGWIAIDREKGLWEYPEATGLYSVSERPVILVIGDYKRGGYEQVFRSANLGGLSYDDAWLVEGERNIDTYSADDLKNFQGIILHGYTYGFGSSAWNKLENYIKQGGLVFVETGWQYVAKDWGSSRGTLSLPQVFPVNQVRWSDIGKTWDDTLIDSEFAKGIDLKDFDPPVWSGQPWGMSLAQKINLREGATAILSKGENILMAGKQVGKGRIIWSGMNIFSHITRQMNKHEADFLGNILKPIFTRKNTDNVKVTYSREYPDSVKFKFNQTSAAGSWLLFRESYSSDWHAKFNSLQQTEKIRLWSAGPGFMLGRLPETSAGDTLILEYYLGLKDGLFAKAISFITGIVLCIYLIIGTRFYALFLNMRFMKQAGLHVKYPLHKVKKSMTEGEEDY